MARLAGSVHGVVVQMTKETFLPLSFGTRSATSGPAGKATYTDGLAWSSYSTSASASAVWS